MVSESSMDDLCQCFTLGHTLSESCLKLNPFLDGLTQNTPLPPSLLPYVLPSLPLYVLPYVLPYSADDNADEHTGADDYAGADDYTNAACSSMQWARYSFQHWHISAHTHWVWRLYHHWHDL